MIISDDRGNPGSKDKGAQAIDCALSTFAIAGRAGGSAVEKVGEGLLVSGVKDDKGADDVGDVFSVVDAGEDRVVDMVGAHDSVEVCAVVDAATTTLLANGAAFPGDEGKGPAEGGAVGVETREAGEELREPLLGGVVSIGIVVERAAGELQARGPQRLKNRGSGRATAVAQTNEVTVQAAAVGRVHGLAG